MNTLIGRVVATTICVALSSALQAQVNTVEFGKNRVQFQKFNWKYYQTENFNTYFAQDGLEIGKYVAQIAEKELPQLEEFIEYGLQRRANVVVYNNFDEMQQSNIGLGIDWQGTGGITKLVNNKMLLYYDANKNNLRKQIRQGIAQVLLQNLLFGDDLGEFAANQALLDMPKWLTDGYIRFAAENWSPELDDQLKSALLNSDYKNFYHFAFDKPDLAGHAFWYYLNNKYGQGKPTYFLYLARIYRNLNNASVKITKKKFKEILKDFMQEQTDIYQKDMRSRRNVPKGQLSVTEEIGKKDFIRFNANPLPRSFSYGVVEFNDGKYSVVLNDNTGSRVVLVKYGARSRADEINPNLPLLAWDNKGTRLAVLYGEEGKIKFFVYDMFRRVKIDKREITHFDQVQDMKYMLDANTLLMSAVKSGQTDIFVYKIDKGTIEQVTNDVYDDLDASFVAFPNKTGIIYSSNRPSANAPDSDTSMPAMQFNIFMVDNWNKTEFKQISQLTNMTFGNARFPSQYNHTHFTFISDENGINNRYAGFFTTQKAGLDTVVFIGDEIIRNPSQKEVDSVLTIWNKTDIDSVGYFATSNDSAYVFPLTNYQYSVQETRTAGDNTMVSEVMKQGDYKNLYKLRLDETALRRRNITARPTEYVRRLMEKRRVAIGEERSVDTAVKAPNDFFESEFDKEQTDSARVVTDSSQVGRTFPAEQLPVEEPMIRKAKLFEYKPPKFFNDYVVAGLNNNTFPVARYQQYAGGTGPIEPSNGNMLNGMVRMGTLDLFEDYRISGGFRIAPNLQDNDILFEFNNLRKRLDWGFTYYRSKQDIGIMVSQNLEYPGKMFSSYYLGKIRYAIDKVRSVRLSAGPRFDKVVFLAVDRPSLQVDHFRQTFGQVTFEYVHDNTLNPATNIWNGLRWKTFIDWFTQISDVADTEGRYLFNAGFDVRYYYPIYRNVIWAGRGAGDFSWGSQKVIYYLGGVDGWLKLRENEKIDPDNGQITGYRYFTPEPRPQGNYAYQTTAVNLRGFKQNVANGNNAIVLNSEFRAPVFSTFFNRPINNAFLRNLQIVQFFDLGSAWNGTYSKIERPSQTFGGLPPNPLTVRIKAGGIGPFAGGYGFGARSTLLGYFIRYDVAWQMNGLFKGKPQTYIALGLDF